MIKNKTLNILEYDKILNFISNFAVLNSAKQKIKNVCPECDYFTCKFLLDKTNEAYELLYTSGVNGVEFYDQLEDELERSKKGAILNFKELLRIARLLKSSRITRTQILELGSENIKYLRDIALNLYVELYLENSIKSKILSETQMADNASEKLFYLRKKIKSINEKIREKLNSYMRAGAHKYLQDNVVSMRNGRYVIPVKSECVGSVKGFIHDRSQSGSTFFIEPQEILDFNNELKDAVLQESLEVERILQELSEQVALISDKLNETIVYLDELDICFAKAHYANSVKGVYPKLNANGIVNIVNGRHPLIDKAKVVPISVNFGENYNYVLISGPNTGGKTVTLKLVGLFTLMATSGIFIPASEQSSISVFENVLVDIGDEQSILEDLSTFSSHVKNIIEIVDNANNKTLVLIDEIGAGTDPDEGSALAKSILEELLNKNSFGIVTTHYSLLKEFALSDNRIINGSMDFNVDTYAPLYNLRIGVPGVSNAIEIANRLGLDAKLIKNAKNNLSKDKIVFEGILANAEKVRSEAQKLKEEILSQKIESDKIYNDLKIEKQKFDEEKQKFLLNAKAQARKIVNEKLEVAEELLAEMKEIFDKEEYNTSDLVKMSTLKNKIENQKFLIEDNDSQKTSYQKVDLNTLKVNDKIFVKSLNSEGIVSEINHKNKSVWALVGSIRINCKISDIEFISVNNSTLKKPTINLKRQSSIPFKPEVNLIGKNVDEAIMELKNFIDKALVNNCVEVRVVHGKGLKILSTEVHKYLKTLSYVESFRFGKYGEGEHGVTIIKFK